MRRMARETVGDVVGDAVGAALGVDGDAVGDALGFAEYGPEGHEIREVLRIAGIGIVQQYHIALVPGVVAVDQLLQGSRHGHHLEGQLGGLSHHLAASVEDGGGVIQDLANYG